MTSILCLDPSSTACGMAFFPDIDATDPAPGIVHVCRPKPVAAINRINFIVAAVAAAVSMWNPCVVVMEYSSGKVSRKNRHRHPSGLAVLGQSQGEVRSALLGMYPNVREVETVDESWTRRVPKDERALRIAAEFPIYDEFLRGGMDGSWKGDPRKKWDGKGLDAGDAIGIGLYWIGRRKERQLMEAGR